MARYQGVDIPLYRLPIRPALATMLLGTIVGMAEQGLRLFVDHTRTRREVYTGIIKAETPGMQRRVAGSERAEIACAWALTQRRTAICWTKQMRHDRAPMPTAARAQARWNACLRNRTLPAREQSAVPKGLGRALRMTATRCRFSFAI